MGAWGSGPFENDYAEDLLERVGQRGIDVIDAVLRDALANEEYLGLEEGSQVLAAAELIAMANHTVRDAFPPDIQTWLYESANSLAQRRSLAKQAVRRVATPQHSEAAEIWLDGPFAGEWSARVHGLIERLC